MAIFAVVNAKGEPVGTLTVEDVERISNPVLIDGKPKKGTGGKRYLSTKLELTNANGTFGGSPSLFRRENGVSADADKKTVNLWAPVVW